MRKKFLLGVAISLALMVAVGPAGPASAHCLGTSVAWAFTGVNHNGWVYEGVTSDLTVTNGINGSSGSNAHWIGITDQAGEAAGTRIVQAGFTASAFDTHFWWEFWSSHPGEGNNAQTVTLPYAWYVGDVMLIKIWYVNSSYWGLQIIDTSIPGPNNVFAANIHPPTGVNAGVYLQPRAVIATEDGIYDDGTETFRSAQARNSQNHTYVLFNNELQTFTHDLYDWPSCVMIEDAVAPNSNAYAYHTKV